MTLPNYDYDVEQAQLTRRQQIIDAMQSSAMSPMNTNLGPGVKVSPLEGLNKILQGVFARKMGNDLQAERSTLGNRYRADGRAGMEQLIEGLSMQPGSVVPEQQGNNPSAYQPQQTMTAQDATTAKRNAVLSAMASGHPMLQQIGQSMLPTLMKQDQMTMKDWLALGDKYDPASVVKAQQTGDPRWLKEKSSVHTANSQVLRVQGDQITPLGDFRNKFGQVGPVGQGPNGAIVGQANEGTGEVKFAPAGTQVHVTTNTNDSAANAMAKELGKDTAKQVVESYTKVAGAPQTLGRLDEASRALDAGIKSGLTADVGLTMSKLGESLGVGKVDPTIANSEQYRAKMAESVLEIIKQLRPASDKDVEYAKQAGGADIKLSADAMSRLIDSAKAGQINAYRQHMKLVERAKSAKGGPDASFYAPYEFDMPINLSADKFDFQGGQFVPRVPGSPSNQGGQRRPEVRNW